MKKRRLYSHDSFSLLGLVLTVLSPAFAQADTLLVSHTNSWHYRKGTNAPPSGWQTAADGALDSTWLTGNGGFGYADNTTETSNCQTLLGDMQNLYSTVCMRRQFTILSAVETNQHLVLTMDYDDGYIAWLDGVYLTSGNITNAPFEPVYNALAPAGHESSMGNSTPLNPPETNDLGVVGNRLGIGTHTLAIVGVNNTRGSTDLIQVADLYVTTNPPPPCFSGSILANTTWHASDSPIPVCGSLTILNGVTLTIEPGTTLQLSSGVNIIVANGGRLLAEGTTNAPILFTRSGSSGNWGGVTINGAVGSPETRIAYARFEFNVSNASTPCITVTTGSAFLDHLTFATPGSPYIHVDGASFTISDCYFPTATAAFEPCHGTRGVRSDGHGLFLRNFFGKPNSYNDVVDFTGGQRTNPIVQFIGNVVSGGDDDGFDIDGTDAWVEGNIFLHQHKNGATPDSSSSVSGGNTTYSAGDPGGTGTETSQITVIGNLFYDCDQAATAKQGNFYTMLNNTIVHQSHVGGIDSTGAVVILADAGTAQGAGIYLEGNVIYDIETLTRNVTNAIVTYSNNILPVAYTGPGGGNTVTNPLLKYIPQLSETYFTNWAQAQIMWDWFSLQTNSPARGTGPNGRDKGGVIPHGASISGEPLGTTGQTAATLTVGINRSGGSIPSVGWPNGSGYTHYKWRFDTNLTWSVETSITNPITLVGLADGAHHIEVIGKNDAGDYQDDASIFGTNAAVTISHTWHVQGPFSLSALRTGSAIALHFIAAVGNTYTIQYRDGLDAAHPWFTLTNVSAQPATADYVVTDSPLLQSRYYRAVTPGQGP